MALFYSHAIFTKKVSSGSDSFSMVGLSSKSSLVHTWILQHYMTSLINSFPWSFFKGGLDLKPKKNVTHIWAVITFFPFFCADIFDTSLLLIVCALKWYIKSLYRHLFLEDISKHAMVTQKWHFLICGKLYSQAPWPQRPKLGVRVAKALSCDRTDSLFSRWTPPEK